MISTCQMCGKEGINGIDFHRKMSRKKNNFLGFKNYCVTCTPKREQYIEIKARAERRAAELLEERKRLAEKRISAERVRSAKKNEASYA